MPPAETATLMKYLKSRKELFYYEFGSGGSTYVACETPNVKTIWSMESDTAYFEKLSAEPVIKQAINSKKLTYMLAEVGCRNNWGHPVPGTPKEHWLNYFQHITDLYYMPDVILIDGRFRVACALYTHMVVDEHATILFDDFTDRSFYHDVLKYFYIIETIGRLVVLKKKINTEIDQADIDQYETDPR